MFPPLAEHACQEVLLRRAFLVLSPLFLGPLEKAVNRGSAPAVHLLCSGCLRVILSGALEGRLLFAEDQSEAQRGEVICLRPHSIRSRPGI